jgi:Ca2+-binding RTX toxin-like protein
MATITGTAGNDNLNDIRQDNATGNDLLLGLGGDDTINSYSGSDTLDGGDGNDQFIFSAFIGFGGIPAAGATLLGGAGNDNLSGGQGNDIMVGGAGDDTLRTGNYFRSGTGFSLGSSENDTLEGGAGNDYFDLEMWVGRPVHMVDGGDGFDVLKGVTIYPDNTTPVVLDLDNITAANFSFANVKNIEALEGISTPGGNDNISASGSRSHNIATGDGEDTVSGGSGDDAILSGNSNDSVSGGGGSDQIYGGTGNDALSGDAGNDQIHGDGGSDVLNGGTGDDNLYGDRVYSFYYEDRNYYGVNPYNAPGDDTLNGGAGSENIYGNLGNDLLNGEDDIDNLEGGSGDDRLRGGRGNDILSGEGNNSTFAPIEGIAGADTFIFDSFTGLSFADLGTDRLTDFQTGIDKIYLDQTIFTELPTVLGETFQVVASLDEAAACAGLIVYSQGHLFYNANGAAAGYGTGGEFATFDNPALVLSGNDFIVGGLYPAN